MSETIYFNNDAEVGILNIVLTHPELSFELTNLRGYMFSSTPNQLIFNTVQDLNEQGLVPEYNMLVSKLVSVDKIREAGGTPYLEHIKSQSYNAENLHEFENEIINAYKARSLMVLATEISKQLKNTSVVDSVITSIRQSLDSLVGLAGKTSSIELSDVLKDAWEEIITRVDKPGLRGLTTGFKPVDLVTTGYNTGELWIIAARPSMGKTAIICNSILSLAKEGIPSLLLEYEMDRQSIIERFLAIKTGISIMDIRQGALSREQLDSISNAIKEFKSYPITIDCSFNTNLDYIVSTIRQIKKQKDVKVVFADYIQLMSERGEEQTAELGRISRTLKLLARELDITIVLLSQLNRLVESRPDKRPLLSDLRQSGNLEEDADLVAFLYRDEYYHTDSKEKGKLEFILKKQRNGPTGVLMLDFDASSNAITYDE